MPTQSPYSEVPERIIEELPIYVFHIVLVNKITKTEWSGIVESLGPVRSHTYRDMLAGILGEDGNPDEWNLKTLNFQYIIKS